RTGFAGAEVEDRALAAARVLLRGLAGRLRLGEDLQHAPAGGARGVERAALDQALDRALVDRARVHALAEVPDRGEGPAALAGGDDRLHGRVADVLHRVEAEADRVAGDHEAVIGGVHVRRQD